MASGTPAGVPAEYQAKHLNWRAAYHDMRDRILRQYLADRECCARIQVANGTWVPSSGLSWHDLANLADHRARAILEQAILQNEEPAIELR